MTEDGRRTSPRHQKTSQFGDWLLQQRPELSFQQPQTSNYTNQAQSMSEATSKEVSFPAKRKRGRPPKAKDGDGQHTKKVKEVAKTPRVAAVAPVKKKPTGRGSRGGRNARPPGNSDDEIQELSPEEARLAEPPSVAREFWTDDDKIKIVSYICASERWSTFKLNQAHVFQEVGITTS